MDGKGCYEENLSDELEDKRERKKLPEAGGLIWTRVFKPEDPFGQEENWQLLLWGTSDPGKREELVQKLNLCYHESQTLRRRHLDNVKKRLRPREVMQFVPQMISTATKPISLYDTNVCFLL